MSDTKKFSSAECLEALIEHIRSEPKHVRMHVNTMIDVEHQLLESTLWPAAFDEDAWFRVSTHRPSKSQEDDGSGNSPTFFGGTDKEVRTYENEAWSDHGKVLEGVVVTEFGEIKEINLTVKW